MTSAAPRVHFPRDDGFHEDLKARAEAWLAATPAVALLDASGNLLYLGPVTDTGFCGTRSSRVVRALESALSGTPAPAQPTLATGCFCT